MKKKSVHDDEDGDDGSVILEMNGVRAGIHKFLDSLLSV